MAVKSDLHLSVLSFRFFDVVHLLVERPADGDPDHHPHPRLLGEERANRTQALVRIGDGRCPQRLGLMRLAKPAAIGEGSDKHLLQLRRRSGHDALGIGKALGIEEPLNRRLESGLVRHHTPSLWGVNQSWPRAEAARPASPPTAAPTRPAKGSAVDSNRGRASKTAAATRTPIAS